MKKTTNPISIVIQLALLASAVLFATACPAATSIGYFESIKNDADPVKNGEYYMRHNIMIEEGSHDTTNYWRGSLILVNTKVRLLSLGKNAMVFQVEGADEKIKVALSKHARRTMDAIAKNMLSTKPVPIEKFDKETQSNIKSGTVALGMTKEQVIITRGYPPAHKTPAIEGNTWQYWSSRYVVYTYKFQDDMLVEGRGLK